MQKIWRFPPKAIAGLLIASALVGCVPQHPVWQTDQELRQVLFQRCLELTAVGEHATHYRDRTGVVKACASEARFQARHCVAHCGPGDYQRDANGSDEGESP